MRDTKIAVTFGAMMLEGRSNTPLKGNGLENTIQLFINGFHDEKVIILGSQLKNVL